MYLALLPAHLARLGTGTDHSIRIVHLATKERRRLVHTNDGYTSCQCNIPADYRIYDGLTKTELECRMDGIGVMHA